MAQLEEEVSNEEIVEEQDEGIEISRAEEQMAQLEEEEYNEEVVEEQDEGSSPQGRRNKWLNWKRKNATRK